MNLTKTLLIGASSLSLLGAKCNKKVEKEETRVCHTIEFYLGGQLRKFEDIELLQQPSYGGSVYDSDWQTIRFKNHQTKLPVYNWKGDYLVTADLCRTAQ
jgi:hypothetical protein